MHVQIEERARFFPGCCLLTNSAQGPFVVTEHLISQPGGARFQVKLSVFQEIARNLGFVPSGAVAEVKDELAVCRRELQEALAEVERLAQAHDELDRAVDLTLQYGAARHKDRLALRKRAPKGREKEAADAA